jgi:hypothetical protein
MSHSRLFTARRDDETARRDLALAAVTVVGLSRLIEPPGVWFVAIFLLGAIVLGTLQVLGDETAHTDGSGLGVPIESLILPAVAAVACLGAIRLVPFGLGLVPALLVTGWLVDRCLALEAHILTSPSGLDTDERTAVLVTTLLVAFLGFVGVAAMVPGGLAQPGTGGAAGGPLPRADLAVLAVGDAVVAFLLGYRAAAQRVATLRDALWSAATYASAIAIGAAGRGATFTGARNTGWRVGAGRGDGGFTTAAGAAGGGGGGGRDGTAIAA